MSESIHILKAVCKNTGRVVGTIASPSALPKFSTGDIIKALPDPDGNDCVFDDWRVISAAWSVVSSPSPGGPTIIQELEVESLNESSPTVPAIYEVRIHVPNQDDAVAEWRSCSPPPRWSVGDQIQPGNWTTQLPYGGRRQRITQVSQMISYCDKWVLYRTRLTIEPVLDEP